jgi:hypothetical protein
MHRKGHFLENRITGAPSGKNHEKNSPVPACSAGENQTPRDFFYPAGKSHMLLLTSKQGNDRISPLKFLSGNRQPQEAI